MSRHVIAVSELVSTTRSSAVLLGYINPLRNTGSPSCDVQLHYSPPWRICFRRCLSVCLPVCLLLATLRKNFVTDLHEIFREGWQWASEQLIKFWWVASGFEDCFPGLSLLADTESSVNRLRCATLQWLACISRHRHSNYDVITTPVLGGGMHCPSASTP